MTFHFLFIVFFLLFFFVLPSVSLNSDGVLLMNFKSSVLRDPLGVLGNWNAADETPCYWRGVTCDASVNISGGGLRVTRLSLPDSMLLASVHESLGMVQFLRFLDLSNNSINGSIPLGLFDASELQSLDFSNNRISGELPEAIGRLKSLRSLNLSGNALGGAIPEGLTGLQNLVSVNLKDNYFSGPLPGGFYAVQELDLSSNLINGSLPSEFGGTNLRYFNASFNRLSGEIPPEFSAGIPPDATLDLSFNNLTGEIPDSSVFLDQDARAYSGNTGLCGVPLENLCLSPSPTSPPAIAAIPKPIESTPDSGPRSSTASHSRLKTGTIIAIVAGDIAALGVIALVFIYFYGSKKQKPAECSKEKKPPENAKYYDWASSSAPSPVEHNWLRTLGCLKSQSRTDTDETSETSSSESPEKTHVEAEQPKTGCEKTGEVVTLDGEKELELETLLKASAYILGASGSSIMYKAVLEDGTALAVRRIGESGMERFREFETQVRVIAKLVHPNLVRIRGFYWGADEKLVIYDFLPNGSLANTRYRKAGCSPCHLPWWLRLKIAKGVARGLTYIHDKKHVHGNLKPSNILLGSDMEPKIGDFGLERLIPGESGYRVYGSTRNFGSKRSTASRDSFQDYASGPTPSPSPSGIGISPYQAPESLRSLKPNPKWDVFSFGVILLEFLTGRVIVSDEMCPGPVVEDAKLEDDDEKSRVLKIADVAIRADMEGKEEALLALVRLGYNCISHVPQKRPSMKEVLQALEKFPTRSSFSSSPPYYF